MILKPLSIGVTPVDEMTSDELRIEREWLERISTMAKSNGRPRGLCANERDRHKAITLEEKIRADWN